MAEHKGVAKTAAEAKVVRRGPRPGRAPLVLSLQDMRKAANKTQTQVAEALNTGQAEISRLEGREDMNVSTLRKYAAALGATCEIVFAFPHGQRIVLDQDGG